MARKKKNDTDINTKVNKNNKSSGDDWLDMFSDGLPPSGMINNKETRIIKHILPSFNLASKCGGFPTGVCQIIHSQAHSGKTLYALLTAESCVRTGDAEVHYFAYERVIGKQNKWLDTLNINKKYYRLHKPRNLEEMFILINKIFEKFKKLREKGIKNKFPVIIIDSITAAPSSASMKKLLEAKKETDIQAREFSEESLLISKWIKTFSIECDEVDAVAILIGQERMNTDKKFAFDKSWRVSLATALDFDNSLKMRAYFKEKIKEGDKVVGFKHELLFEKNKLGPKGGIAQFYISNGEGDAPMGIDIVPELVDLALHYKLIDKQGKNYIQKVDRDNLWFVNDAGNERSFNGKNDLYKYLRRNKNISEKLNNIINQCIDHEIELLNNGKIKDINNITKENDFDVIDENDEFEVGKK